MVLALETAFVADVSPEMLQTLLTLVCFIVCHSLWTLLLL